MLTEGSRNIQIYYSEKLREKREQTNLVFSHTNKLIAFTKTLIVELNFNCLLYLHFEQ